MNLDDHCRNIFSRGRLDTFQPRRGIDFHHHWSMVGAQYVHAGHIEPHGPGRAHRGGSLLRGDADQTGATAVVEVGAKLALPGLTLHGRHYSVADNETTDIRTTCLFHVLLYQDVGLQTHKGPDHTLSGLLGLRQHDADALVPSSSLMTSGAPPTILIRSWMSSGA